MDETQLDLWSVRVTDPVTSAQAAAMAAETAQTGRVRACAALVAAGPGGLTDFELEAATGVKQTSIGKRRHELVKAGLVSGRVGGDGKPVTRPAPSGSPAIVWAALPAARDWLEAQIAAGAQ